MRGDGASKEKNGTSGASQGSSTGGCGRKYLHREQARLAHKHSVNQKIADRNVALAESYNTIGNSTINKNNSVGKKTTQKQKPVEDIVKYIEGSSAGKNKIKRDRQKQDRQEAAKLQQENEKRLQEEVTREQHRIEEERRRNVKTEKEVSPMSKKQLKKANQRAKKLAEQEIPFYSPQRQGNFTPGNITSNPYLPSVSQSVSSMDELKSKHQRELEMLELKHRHAIEEEQMMTRYKQGGQSLIQPQYQQPQYQPQSSQSLGNFGAGRSTASPLSSFSEDLKAQLLNTTNNLTTNTMNQVKNGLTKPPLDKYSNISSYPSSKPINPPTLKQNSQPSGLKTKQGNNSSVGNGSNAGSRTNLPEAAKEALDKAGNSSGNMIRISRNAQGGVDFASIPASEVNQKKET